MAATITSALRRVAVPLLIAALTLLTTLGLGEVMLRAIGFSHANFWQPDDITGSSLRPGSEGWNRNEGNAFVAINSQGLRDREHSLAKPPGVYRIAVLGDSYSEAMQVTVGEAFWSLLPERLTACGFQPGKRIEIVNFGVSGYGTAQELLTLRHRAWDYAPDLVLVAFFPGNDVRNNSRRLESDAMRPFYTLRDGELVPDNSFRGAPAYREIKRLARQRGWLQDLRLYQLARRLRAGELHFIGDNAPVARALADGERTPALTEKGLDEKVFREPDDDAWREAWAVSDALLKAMQAETRARGADFLVTVLSTPGAVYPDTAMRRRYADYLGAADLFYAERRIERLGRENGFAVAALGRPMQGYADATGTYLHGFSNQRLGFGHWNQAGHALAADLIARRLCTGGAP